MKVFVETSRKQKKTIDTVTNMLGTFELTYRQTADAKKDNATMLKELKEGVTNLEAQLGSNSNFENESFYGHDDNDASENFTLYRRSSMHSITAQCPSVVPIGTKSLQEEILCFSQVLDGSR